MHIGSSDGRIGFDSNKYLGHDCIGNEFSIRIYTTDHPKNGLCTIYRDKADRDKAAKEIGEQLKAAKRLEVTYYTDGGSKEPVVTHVDLCEGILAIGNDNLLVDRLRELLNISGYFKLLSAKFV